MPDNSNNNNKTEEFKIIHDALEVFEERISKRLEGAENKSAEPEPANKISTGLEPAENISTGLKPDETKSTGLKPADNQSYGLKADENLSSALKPAVNGQKTGVTQKIETSQKPEVPKKRRRKVSAKKRNGIIAFIVLGLVCIAAASAWIVDHWNKDKATEVAKTDAEYIAEATEFIKAPEIKTRTNASNNYHVISHRGYPAKAEEHTFEGYDLAIEAGTMYIEQDIVSSADGTLYVSHDETPYRMTGQSGTYASMTDEEIDKLRTHGGSKILKLTDVFDRYGMTVGYVIELKDSSSTTVDEFCKVIKDYGMESNVIVESFDASVLDEVEKVYPDMTKMFLCETTDGRALGISKDSVDIVCVRKDLMNEFGRNAVHNSGKKFGVWTIDTSNHIMDAIMLGVDYYFTNDTGLALDLEKQYRKDN